MSKSYKDKKGYLRFTDSGELCHRWMFRKYLNLQKKDFESLGFEVHHIDNKKDNYKIENLMLVTKEGHKAIHERSWSYENITLVTKIIFPIVLFASIMLFFTGNIIYFYSILILSLIGVLFPYAPKFIRKYLFFQKILKKNQE